MRDVIMLHTVLFMLCMRYRSGYYRSYLYRTGAGCERSVRPRYCRRTKHRQVLPTARRQYEGAVLRGRVRVALRYRRPRGPRPARVETDGRKQLQVTGRERLHGRHC
ncbi:hypothetical protein DPMN_021384 [Dreissena polymorpha]|uniref:Uncharacterized protein n=1 Tax=Dreissena polymorpha TaxID=45954 RepID=A0A9D4NP02_DREPO|nr:hypothetical protein DPMN_021384 [Dreissena polymorpha]